MTVSKSRALACAAVLAAPILMGAKGKGCDGAAFSRDPAPDMSGEWTVSYDDRLDVEITIGGATYTEELGPNGGVITIDHEGQPLTFDLDCAKPLVVCPSEVWPSEVSIRQNDATYPHRIWLQVPDQQCNGQLVDPEPSECGPNTENPDCAQVCNGETVTITREAFGVIDNPGESFRIGLHAGIASNGVNCVLLGGSYAEGALESTGDAEQGDWEAVSTEGDVVTVYGGGCLWAGDPNMDGQLEALVVGAQVRFRTGFKAQRAGQLP